MNIRMHRIMNTADSWKIEDLLTKTNFLGCGFKSLGFRVLSRIGAEWTERKVFMKNIKKNSGVEITKTIINTTKKNTS